MPDFEPIQYDPAVSRLQLEELRTLLDSSEEISESSFRDFFEPRTQLRALVGTYNSNLFIPDRVAWEYPIFGDFRCDFAVGQSSSSVYTFVEYEDARPNSLFVKQGEKATRAWSPRFERGYGQVVDWFYKLHTMTDTPDMEARLGKRAIRYIGLLVIGRDRHMDAGERMRLDWRRDHVVVNSRHVVCVTYDQLVRDLMERFGVGAAGTPG